MNFLIAGLLLMSATFGFGAPDDATTALQKGLFEEEANHNLGAAIQMYQTVVAQFDKDRKLAATAVFRLGECYRKQGRTNDATAQFERVLREFADQDQLVAVSQQNLMALGGKPAAADPAATEPPPVTSVEAEEVKRIQAMIKDSPDLVNATDGTADRATPLINAAKQGQLVVARFLVGAGADVEAKSAWGRTALFVAAYQGHKGLVEFLLASKAQTENPDVNRKTPLHAAAERGFRSVAEVLLLNGANVNAVNDGKATPLHFAVANGFRSVAELLLDKGADVNAIATDVRISGTSWSGTPLNVAATRGDLALFEMLLNHKADPEIASDAGFTPLHIAARNGYLPVVQVLLSKGARVDTRNLSEGYRGWTALHYAVVEGRKDVVSLLLANKADPNAKIETGFSANRPGPIRPDQQAPVATGYTPLLLATAKCYTEIVNILIAAKADPNIKSESGDAPVLNAITLCSPPERSRILALLLEHGARTEPADPNGATALMLAAEKRDKESLELLLRHKADPNARNKYGSTALLQLGFTLSGSGPYQDVVPMAEDLIEAKADVNAQLKDGRTALKYLTDLLSRPMQNSADELIRKFADLLRKAGAVEDLPQLDRIEVARPSARYRETVFWKGTNDYNNFSLFELLSVQYNLCAALPRERISGPQPLRPGVPFTSPLSSGPGPSLAFPDFSDVIIRRATPDGRGRKEMRIALTAILEAGKCSGDIPLKWGDVVEIPEADHPINVIWQGLPEKVQTLLIQCLSRTVEVRVKGQSTNMVLNQTFPGPSVQFALRPVLNASGLLRASSDLSRVKVTRHDPSIGQSYEMQLDCSRSANSPDLWLRQGDLVEVPEKP